MPIIKLFWTDFYKIDSLKSKYWILVFAVYALLLSIAVWKHEPWMDEAQSWLLVSDLSVGELFTEYLRYDGHPGLWYLLVMIPAKLGLPYVSINVLSAVLSATGVFLFLRHSPFPPVVKILFPFSYFVFFQYGVVARSYCLIPLFLFLIAINYEKRFERPILYSLLLCLFANVSAHALLISGALLSVHLLDVWQMRRQLDKQSKIHQSLAVLMFGLASLFVIWTLLPPPDQLFAGENNLSFAYFLFISKWMISGALLMDESSRVINLQIIASFAIFLVTLYWLRRKKLTLLYLFPLLLNLILFGVKYRNLWHEGILFFLWIFVLWISFDKERNNNSPTLRRTVTALITIVLATQIYWTAYAVSRDFYHNYSGSRQLAEYIKENDLENKQIFVSGWKSIAVLPYFDENIFYNLNNGSKLRFWLWSMNNPAPVGYHSEVVDSIQREQPDVVIFASDHMEPNTTIKLEGYRFVKAFEGNLYWKTGIYEPDSYWIFQKEE
jgi:hypothetical protein